MRKWKLGEAKSLVQAYVGSKESKWAWTRFWIPDLHLRPQLTIPLKENGALLYNRRRAVFESDVQLLAVLPTNVWPWTSHLTSVISSGNRLITNPPLPPPAGLCCLLNKISGVDQIAESPREAQQCPRADVESEELDGVPFRRCFLPVFLLPFLVFSEWSFFSGSS